jgi:murein DD-endopeptidase MepM/ murein hydrolase activator NlpD
MLAVSIAHGDCLISMYFHLADIRVAAGDEIRMGHVLGRAGSTGRTTGPIRWHDSRFDPRLVLEAPGKIPEIEDPTL